MPHHHENTELIKILLECTQTCDYCATACLNEQDAKMLVRCIKLDMECADICYEAVRLVGRQSEIAKQFMQICERICMLCGEECARHQEMHDHCRECAQACRRCAEACRIYLSRGALILK